MMVFRVIILISFILAAIITPTPDPINQSIMALPVIVLYALSAIFIMSLRVFKQRSPLTSLVRTSQPIQSYAKKPLITAPTTQSLTPAPLTPSVNIQKLKSSKPPASRQPRYFDFVSTASQRRAPAQRTAIAPRQPIARLISDIM